MELVKIEVVLYYSYSTVVKKFEGGVDRLSHSNFSGAP